MSPGGLLGTSRQEGLGLWDDGGRLLEKVIHSRTTGPPRIHRRERGIGLRPTTLTTEVRREGLGPPETTPVNNR